MGTTMTSYWLAAKFGASSASIGLVLALTYGCTAAVALAGVRLAERFGTLKAVLALQLGGIVFVLLLPAAPWFWLAALFVAGQAACSLGTRGSRSAAALEQRRSHWPRSVPRRAWLRRLNTLLLRIGVVLWPGAFGQLLDRGHAALPFYIAAAVQLLALLWYLKAGSVRTEQAPSEAALE